MERLSAEDQVMLWPDAIWPQEIGALAVLDGGALLDTDGRLQIGAVHRAVEGRLSLVPRFRQLLHVPRRGLGGPLWVDAPVFNLADHVRVAQLPAPGDEAALLLAVERLRRHRLDRSRPLWEMWFLPGLPDKRVGLFVRMHHAIADGVAGVATVGAFLDPAADTPASPVRPWTPAPPPTARELLADNLRQHAIRLGRALATLAYPVTAARHARAGWSAVREFMAAKPAAATSLNHVIGADRTLALVRSSLDLVKQIAHTHGATVNDVLLAVTAGGLRALLRSRGELVSDLIVRIDVPVTLRPRQARDHARGNLIGQMLVALPVGVSDHSQRLAQIAADTATGKANSHPSVGVLLRSRLARRVLLKLLDRQPVNVTSADLPGPPQPVYLAGAQVLEVFPVLPLMANVSLGVGALSYAGQFNITAVADLDAYPDLHMFTTGVRDELAALAASISDQDKSRLASWYAGQSPTVLRR
jgi:diacylglycerol O-acyltransferase / wax synthase